MYISFSQKWGWKWKCNVPDVVFHSVDLLCDATNSSATWLSPRKPPPLFVGLKSGQANAYKHTISIQIVISGMH